MRIEKEPAGYMAQLDGLRAVAVGMVILFHWTPQVKQLALGGLGVQLFFVLSGYLITGILLDARAKAQQVGGTNGQIIKSFYGRRFLRIFPLYYLVLALTFILGAPHVQAYMPWHLAYLSNIAIFKSGNWIGEASHLWSLAVEEQFYLFWPLVILFTPQRYLATTITGFILSAPAFELACAYFELGGSRTGVLPISSFHYLGAGALLALFQRSSRYKHNSHWRKAMNTRMQLAGLAGLVIFLLIRFGMATPAAPGLNAAQEFAMLAFFVSITQGAAAGYKGLAGAVLASGSMLYIGRISYGLYLLHNFIPYFTNNMLRQSGINAAEVMGAPGLLLLYTSLLLILSALSWHFFESRLNKYKSYFPYVVARQEQEVVKV